MFKMQVQTQIKPHIRRIAWPARGFVGSLPESAFVSLLNIHFVDLDLLFFSFLNAFKLENLLFF